MKKLIFILLLFNTSFASACPIAVSNLNNSNEYTNYIITLESHPLGTAFFLKEQHINLQKTTWMMDFIENCGFEVAKSEDRNNIKYLIDLVAGKSINKNDYPYIKQWFTTALKNNSYETIIALRQIYKKNIFFHDKNVEKILKEIYQEAMAKY